MNYAAEHKTNIKASAWAIGVHVLLFLLFMLVKYGTPVIDEPAEMGMEVNLGNSDDGYGTNQPMNTEDPSPNEVAMASNAVPAQSKMNDEVLKTEEPDAPVINTKPVKNKANSAEENNKPLAKSQAPNQQPQTSTTQRPRYVFNGSTGKGGNSATANLPGGSEGNTRGTGDRGVPGGTPGAANYSGIPGRGGNGISHTLTGRAIVAYPPPDADFRESGKVVIRITVNREGIIVNKQVRSATNAEIRGIALRKLDKVRFNKSDNAPEEQFGDITFVFKTRT